jgi:hypothetical protein
MWTHADLGTTSPARSGRGRAAFDQLRAEGLVVSYQGKGIYVREQAIPRRLSTDIATSLG